MPFPLNRMAGMMFKKRLKKFGYSDPWEMIKNGVEEGKIHIYPCSMTMEMMGFKQEEFHDFCEKPVGAAAFLENCDDADTIISL